MNDDFILEASTCKSSSLEQLTERVSCVCVSHMARRSLGEFDVCVCHTWLAGFTGRV